MKKRPAFLTKQLLPAVIFFGLAVMLQQVGWLETIENVTLDQRTRLRERLYPSPVCDDLALIGIDEISLKEYGRWPWNRRVHGEFLKVVGQAKPSVVSWDILFTEPSPDDEAFASATLAGGANVVLGAMRAEADEGLTPDHPTVKTSRLKALTKITGDQAAIRSSKALLLPTGPLGPIADVGFVDTPPGSDGVRREVPMVVKIGEGVYPTLSLQSLIQHWKVKPDQVEVRLGDAVLIETEKIKRRIPIDATGAYLVNYRHALEGFAAYGYSLLDQGLKQKYASKQDVELPPLEGRILMVGQVADGLSDFGPTPFSPLTPLVLVHTNVIENVLREDYARRAPMLPIALVGFALTLAGLVFFSDRKIRDVLLFSFGVPLVYAAAAVFGWLKLSLWLPIVWPVLGFGSAQVFMLARRVIAEQRSKEQIKGMFGTYVSPALVNRMVAAGESPQLGGHEDEITAYFSDIQGFSTFSEKLPPDKLVELMNEYLTACTDIVQEEGGTLDKYIGDAVVAMFGAPIALPDHAFRACVATQRVQKKLLELRGKWQSEGDKWPEIVWRMQSRIGLNSGNCIIGNMGSRTRFNYTMMGDNVNLAARMESQAKSWGVYTMCADATKLACEQHGGDRVVFRPLGRIVVMGRSKPVPFHEIVGLKEDVTPETKECLQLFSDGLSRYYARDWDGALGLFARSQLLEPNIPGKTPGVSSNPSLVFADLTRHYQDHPPAEGWDGVHVAKSK